MSGGSPFILKKYVSRIRFEGILGYLCYIVQKDIGCYYGLFHKRKMR